MVGYVKTMQLEHRWARFTGFFEWFGQKWHIFEYRLNRFVQQQQNKQEKIAPPKPLAADVAAVKGVETFYEMVFYAIAIGIPIYEFNRSKRAELKKEEALNQRLTTLEEDMKSLRSSINAHLSSTIP